jgi:hypothetical protein
MQAESDERKMETTNHVKLNEKLTIEWCFNGDWQGIVVGVVKHPCLFCRVIQRLVLSIHLRKLRKQIVKNESTRLF